MFKKCFTIKIWHYATNLGLPLEFGLDEAGSLLVQTVKK